MCMYVYVYVYVYVYMCICVYVYVYMNMCICTCICICICICVCIYIYIYIYIYIRGIRNRIRRPLPISKTVGRGVCYRRSRRELQQSQVSSFCGVSASLAPVRYEHQPFQELHILQIV